MTWPNKYLFDGAGEGQGSRTEVDSKRLHAPGVTLLGLFINLHENHCPGPALSTKWLENYMEPHASSEILTRSDLTAWLNPKPGGLAHEIFRAVHAPSRGSGGMLPQKILNISVLRFAENAFLTF